MNFWKKKGSEPIRQKQKLLGLVLRPQVALQDLLDRVDSFREAFSDATEEIIHQAEVSIKYEGYIQKEQEMVARFSKLENLYLKEDFDYLSLSALSMEARQKLTEVRPKNLGQASRISGVSPADISVLMVYLSK